MRTTAFPGERRLLARWARFAVRRRGLVLTAWVGGLVALVVVWRVLGADLASNFTLPGTESQIALDLLEERFPQQAGDSAYLVFKAYRGVADPAIRARIDAVLAQAAVLPRVIRIVSPFQQGESGVSQDGRIAYATVQYDAQTSAIPRPDVEKLLALTDSTGGDGLIVEAGGRVVQFTEREPPGTTEAIGLLFAIVILLVAFGSVVAMGLPLVTALFGLIAGFAVIGLAAHILDFPFFITSFAAMIGIGVGIDYALLIVTRYREGLHRGRGVEESVIEALATAGRSVLFAGSVVVIAMLGLLTNGIPFVSALGIAGAVVVALAVLVALTLLPALLGFAGHRIDRWRIPFFHATDLGDAASVWYRFAALIQRRPLPWALGALAVLLLLASPTLDLQLGFADAGNTSTRQHSRRAYDLLAEGFGPGFNGPLLVVFDLKDAGEGATAAMERVRMAVAATPGIALVTPPTTNQSGDAAVLTAIPTTAPQDQATQRLIHHLREQVLPPAVAGSGMRVYVAGGTAAFIDIGDRITERLPLFFGAVIGLSFLLLMVVFRSVVVALKAAVMNLLSIGASFGVVVAVFQWGWGADLFGVKAGPIETFLPMMLFAILFGLSMDYEVFLISRVREEYLRTGNNANAVAHGLAVTARVITAAAAIMVAVFLSFVLGPERTIKEFGLGLATAIFVDATIVRLVLVPATMELLGDANWWLPRWLDRLLPRLDIEGAAQAEPQAATVH